jgi:hypothetical protein
MLLVSQSVTRSTYYEIRIGTRETGSPRTATNSDYPCLTECAIIRFSEDTVSLSSVNSRIINVDHSKF